MDENRREGKGRPVVWGTYMNAALTARMICTKVFGRTSILVGCSGLIRCEPDDHPIFQSIHSAKSPLFYSSFLQNHPGGEYITSAASN